MKPSLIVPFGFAALLSAPIQAFAPLMTRVRCSSQRQVNSVAQSLSLWNEERAALITDANSSSGSSQSSLVPKLVFLVSANQTAVSKFGSTSPVGHPLLYDAVQHLGQKANWFANGQLEWEVVSLTSFQATAAADSHVHWSSLVHADIVIAMGLHWPDEIRLARDVFDARRRDSKLHQQKGSNNRRYFCHFALDCSDNASHLTALVGPYDPDRPSKRSRLVPWTKSASGKRMYRKMLNLLERWTSDDFCYALMLYLNQYSSSGQPIDWVRHRIDASWEKGLFQNSREFYNIMTQCGDCAIPCLKDAQCRECLGHLMRLDPHDQAHSYQTLVSYESDVLTKFSLCIFTKKNIFQCDAKIPSMPMVQPLQTWRGRKVDESTGRALLVGHLNDSTAPEGSLRLPVSWKVACGANAAYDQFPCQNQIFYPARGGSSRDMWYDPVFRVETLDGRHVWCTRHYRVRPGPTKAATFRFSVLDNGVTTDEFWTIVDAADDLSWIVFHYAGAAKAVGLSYLGALLCTADGSMPEDNQLPRIWNCLRSAGIQPWELNRVDNDMDSKGASEAGPPPLDLYRRHTTTATIATSADATTAATTTATNVAATLSSPNI